MFQVLKLETMEEWIKICETSNREAVENIYYGLNRRNVGKYIYDMLNYSSMPNVFRPDNISFISYMIGKEELFSLLTCKNIGYLFNGLTLSEIVSHLRDYPLILRSLHYNPRALLTIDNGSLIDYYCQTFNDSNIAPLDIMSIAKLDEDKILNILTMYPHLFKTTTNISQISNLKNVDLFTLCIKDLKTGQLQQLYYEIMINSTDVRFLDLLLHVPIKHDKIPLSSSINMIQHVFTTRKPTRYVLETVIGNAIKEDKYDIIDYLLSIGGDIDVWVYIEEKCCVRLILIYTKYFKLTDSQIDYIHDNLSTRDVEKLHDVLIYKNKLCLVQ